MRPRLTQVSTVYHSLPNVDPVGFTYQHVLDLESEEPPWTRPRLLISEEWQPLPTGWLTSASLVVIDNLSKEATIEIGFRELSVSEIVAAEGTWLIPPGCHHEGRPSDVSRLILRSLQGQARCTVTVFPE